MKGRIDVRDVRARLKIAQVFETHGVTVKRGRARTCPSCGQRSGDDVTVSNGCWHCKVCGKGGDAIAAQAAFEQLADFQDVLVSAAALAGVDPSEDPADREARRDEQDRISAELDAADRAEKASAAGRIAAQWDGLARDDLRGGAYLEKRLNSPGGINRVNELVQRDVVRFMPGGEPAMALRDLVTGDVVGIQYRAIDGSEPKIKCVRGSRLTGAVLHGKLTDIDPQGVDIAVIVEGMLDTLAAFLEFPGCAIYGAPGASQMEAIAAAVAPAVVAARGWMLIVPDRDGGTGEHAAAMAAVAADAAGLEMDAKTFLVDVEPHHDLADARRAGWSWSWPR